MKIVRVKNDVLLTFLVLLLIGCNQENNISTNAPTMDYERDSIFYRINIYDGKKREKEMVLLTREYIVGDSIFGGIEVSENLDKAINYRELVNKKEETNKSIKYLNTIFIEDKGKFQKVMNFKSCSDDIIVLRSSEQSDFIKNGYTTNGCGGSEYLRVLQMDIFNMTQRSINICYDEQEKQWNVFSIEYIEFDKNRKAHYCIDSTTYYRGYSKDEYEIYDFNLKGNCHYLDE
ncbi:MULTISPECIES: hypothetical protein [Capnocytophaga]|uniref:hypothetical protein n=1 Tax=Capnocytophaga TaxID=1016 RepID=UPI00370D1B46